MKSLGFWEGWIDNVGPSLVRELGKELGAVLGVGEGNELGNSLGAGELLDGDPEGNSEVDPVVGVPEGISDTEVIYIEGMIDGISEGGPEMGVMEGTVETVGAVGELEVVGESLGASLKGLLKAAIDCESRPKRGWNSGSRQLE